MNGSASSSKSNGVADVKKSNDLSETSNGVAENKKSNGLDSKKSSESSDLKKNGVSDSKKPNGASKKSSDAKNSNGVSDSKKSTEALNAKKSSGASDSPKSTEASDSKKGTELFIAKKSTGVSDSKKLIEAFDSQKPTEAFDTKKLTEVSKKSVEAPKTSTEVFDVKKSTEVSKKPIETFDCKKSTETAKKPSETFHKLEASVSKKLVDVPKKLTNLLASQEMTTKENGKVSKCEEKPAIQDASKDSPSQSLSTKKDFPLQKEKSSFSLPVLMSPLRIKSSESSKKHDSTFIKVDYLKTTKVEKTKETVSRVLDFVTEKVVKVEKEIDEKEVQIEIPVKVEIKIENQQNFQTPIKEVSIEKLPKQISENGLKETPTKRDSGSSSKHSSSKHQSSSHHKSSSHSSSSHHKSSSSSSAHKSHSSSSSSKDCSRCYRRSKIKKTNVGIQVRPDESNVPKPPTRPLEFEASHRVGVNRHPVTIDTNLSYLKYGRFYHIEVHPNGGASIVHMYQDELDSLRPDEMNELVDEFFELVFSEDENGFAFHVMGVVHDAARYLPDLLEHMAENYSNLTVKAGVIGRNNDIETCTMMQYYDQVAKNYDEGTVRFGPLHQISLVGKVHEEVGGYFPDLLGKLEASPFLKKSMPWGKMSVVQMDPRLSNDGPILWIRPGEQLIPTADLKTPLKRQRARINELRNLQYLPRSSEAREILFEDRTKAHADHVGMGHERQTTAAVGEFEV